MVTIDLITGFLGSGKTTFIKQVCQYLGIDESVTSPTFSIVNEYVGGDKTVYHFDFYRLKNSQEAVNLGFDEYILSGNYCLMEWPDIIQEILPPNTVMVNIEVLENNNSRVFTF